MEGAKCLRCIGLRIFAYIPLLSFFVLCILKKKQIHIIVSKYITLRVK